jgi:ubiquinone/menaquinone biosynthesis C-methylase UbiE
MNAGKIVGMDIDSETLNLAKMIYSDLEFTNIEFRKNKAGEKLPAEIEEFDIISCNAVLEHIHPDLREKYINELQKKVKRGGYFIVSDTPNKLWLKEGHTTGIWLLNYLPFKLKCWLGSKTKRFKGVSYSQYNYWIEQGIIGVTYGKVFNTFDMKEWKYEDDLKIKREYRLQIFNNINRKFFKKIVRYFLYAFAFLIDVLYLKYKRYPSLAISPVLIFSFKRKN